MHAPAVSAVAARVWMWSVYEQKLAIADAVEQRGKARDSASAVYITALTAALATQGPCMNTLHCNDQQLLAAMGGCTYTAAYR